MDPTKHFLFKIDIGAQDTVLRGGVIQPGSGCEDNRKKPKPLPNDFFSTNSARLCFAVGWEDASESRLNVKM